MCSSSVRLLPAPPERSPTTIVTPGRDYSVNPAAEGCRADRAATDIGLASMRVSALAESRSIDDQAARLDNTTLA